MLVELRDAQLRHALVIELDAVAAALTAHDDVRRDVAGRLRAVGRSRLRVQRADDVDGELHVRGAHALRGRDLLDLARGDRVEMAVDETRDDPLVDAAPHSLQAQALREVTRADTRGLEGLEGLEHRLGLRLAHLRRARRLRERHPQIAAPVEGADEEDGNGALPFPARRIGERGLLHELLLKSAARGAREDGILLRLGGSRLVPTAGAAEIGGERRDILRAVRLLALARLSKRNRTVIVDFERGILEVFLLNDAAEVLRGELQDLDGLLHLHRHREVLRKIFLKRL